MYHGSPSWSAPIARAFTSLAIAAVVFATSPVYAILNVTTSSNPLETFYSADVSNSDLLHGLSGTHLNYQTFPGTRTNDGVHGGAGDGTGIAWANNGNTTSSTFEIPNPIFGQSWNISTIRSIAAWNSAGFMNQKYDISVRYLGSNTFVPLTSIDYQPFSATGSGATRVVINDSTGTVATGVQAIRFSILDTVGDPGGGTTFREFDVHGSVLAAPAGFVVNPSFEAPDIANGAFAFGSFTGWNAINNAGVQDFNAEVPVATDGAQHAFANGTGAGGPSTLHQTLADVITNGSTYTLSVDVGQLSNFSGSLATIRLFGETLGPNVALSNANGTAELVGIAPPSGGPYLLDRTVSYTALPFGDPFAGQRIGIALVGTSGTQVLFDDVRFFITAAAVPEPMSVSLWCLAGLCVIGVGYARRRAW